MHRFSIPAIICPKRAGPDWDTSTVLRRLQMPSLLQDMYVCWIITAFCLCVELPTAEELMRPIRPDKDHIRGFTLQPVRSGLQTSARNDPNGDVTKHLLTVSYLFISWFFTGWFDKQVTTVTQNVSLILNGVFFSCFRIIALLNLSKKRHPTSLSQIQLNQVHNWSTQEQLTPLQG